jgi:hypothetical protein
MYSGKSIFAQLAEHLPLKAFHRCVDKYRGDHRIRSFSCYDQFLCMAFAQLTFRESLRDIESCLRAMRSKLYHCGIRGNISRSTLSDANENRDWRIFAEFAQVLINIARRLYQHDEFGVEIEETVYALDSTTIDLCLSLFPWAPFRKTKGAIKLHTLLDIRGSIPSFIWISDGKLHDVNILDELLPEPGAIYLMDRGYLDFARLYELTIAPSFFITRAKHNFKFRRLYSNPVDRSTVLICDQVIVLSGFYTHKNYPEKLRRIKFYDEENDDTIVLMTNHFSFSAPIICQLYKCRWKVELFFKWIKQHLRIKAFYGTSENAVKTQIWIAISVYLLIAIIRKRLKLDIGLYTFLQILSLTLFEKGDILQLVRDTDYKIDPTQNSNQLNLFNF